MKNVRVGMSRQLRLATIMAAVAASLAPALSQNTDDPAPEWQSTKPEGTDLRVTWVHALGTVARPDFCGAYASLKVGADFRQKPFQAEVRRKRLGCLMIQCAPSAGGQPRRFTADLILFGSATMRDEPAGAARSLTIRLSADGGPVELVTESETRIEPMPFAENRAERQHYVRIGLGPFDRGTVERLMRGRSLAVPAINGRFATMAGTADLATAAYRFDMRGASAALARLDTVCK